MKVHYDREIDTLVITLAKNAFARVMKYAPA
jgi:hypothetical protein